jgi:hypothetical protein
MGLLRHASHRIHFGDVGVDGGGDGDGRLEYAPAT